MVFFIKIIVDIRGFDAVKLFNFDVRDLVVDAEFSHCCIRDSEGFCRLCESQSRHDLKIAFESFREFRGNYCCEFGDVVHVAVFLSALGMFITL